MADHPSEFDSQFEDDLSHEHSSSPLWLFSLLFAGGLCLLLRNPLAAAFFPVIAAAEPSFRTAAWIRRLDPETARARACSRFLYATGCWRALVSGIVAFIVLIVICVSAGQAPSEAEGLSSLAVIAVAAVATSLTGLWSLWTAWFSRVRVWVHPKLMNLAGLEFANLSALHAPPGMSNHAVYVSAVSLAVPPLIAGTGWMIFTAMTNPPDRDVTFSFAGGMGVLLGGPLISVFVLMSLSRRLFASSPADCWSITRESLPEDEFL
jgi:hypothetical protein